MMSFLDELKEQADRKYQRGIDQYNQKQFSEAAALFQESLIVYQQVREPRSEAGSYYWIGLCQETLGQYQKAITAYQKALSLYRALDVLEWSAKSAFRSGYAAQSLQAYSQAITYYQQAVPLCQSWGDCTYEAVACYNMGVSHERLQQYQEAIDCYKMALDLYQELADDQWQGRTLLVLGRMYDNLKQTSQADSYYQQVLTFLPALGIDPGQIGSGQSTAANFCVLKAANQTFQQAIQLYAQCRFQEALSLFQQILPIYQDLKDYNFEAQCLGNIGLIYYNSGQYTRAIEHHNQSLLIARDIGDRKGEARFLSNLGIAYGALGQYARAIEYNNQSLLIVRDIGDRKGEAYSLSNLGIAYRLLGQYAYAIEYHNQSLLIARDIGDRKGEACSLYNLGIAYDRLGQYAHAIEYHNQSLLIARDIGDRRSEASCLTSLGIAYDLLKQHTHAIEYYNQSLLIARDIGDRNGEACSLSNLGIAYGALGQYADAIQYNNQSLLIRRDIGDRNGEASCLHNLGSAYAALEQYADAIQYNNQSLLIFRKIGDRSGEARSLSNLGFALSKEGSVIEAKSHLYHALEVLESLRQSLTDEHKVSFFETLPYPYNILQKVLVAQGEFNAALEVAERGRGRAFVELMAKRIAPDQLDNLLHSQLAQPPGIGKIQQLAQDHQATLVEYSLATGTVLSIWVVQPTGEVFFRSIDLSSLKTSLFKLVDRSHLTVSKGRDLEETEAAIELLLQGLHEESLEILRDAAVPLPAAPRARTSADHLHQLYQLLIEPIADLLPAAPNRSVVFIPHRVLFLVPFAALQDADGHYLIEKHTILTAPSIQVLDLTQQQRQQMGVGCKGWQASNPPRTVIAGNPTMPCVGYPPRQLQPLPGAEAEALAIARYLHAEALIGDRATEPEVVRRMATAQIIHLATHGLLNEMEGGVPGAIALAAAENQDGLLTANDILDLQLQAELVVLSGCNTGRGQITGDGVVGLSRAFMTAGVPSVIVTLWSIPDAPTASLMTEFYRNWQQGLNKAQALRQAMLTTLKTHPHPKNWAAFTLMGEAE